MKQKNILKTLLLAAAATTSLALRAPAQESTQPAPVPVTTATGLLGQTYAGLSYSYIDLDDAPVNAHSYAFDYNESLNPGFDAAFHYDYTQAGLVDAYRARTQMIDGSLRAFLTSQAWGKPFAEAGIGYAWTRAAGGHDNSIVWLASVGAEFQILPALTVTPYIKYIDAPDIAAKDTWNFGVKANYWFNSQWALTAGVERNDNQDMKYTVGTNFRF